jgi:branched-chain amino acid transport system permease protein
MDYLLHILIMCGIYAILSLSLNLLVGYTGLPALGHAAFSCVGAYASALLALNFGLSPWLGLVVAGLAASVVGLIIGIPSLRIRGDYLALTTFGFAMIVYGIAKNWIGLTRGPLGLPGIPGFELFGWRLSANWAYLILVTAGVVVPAIVIGRIVGSPFGRVLQGIREDEIATAAMGKNVDRFKVTVFVVGSFFAGVAGCLYAHYVTFIDPSSFTLMESILILLMVVFGGLASIRGSILGAVLLVVFPEVLRFVGFPSAVEAPLRQMIYGLLLILLMMRRPQGLLGRFRFQ